MDQPRLDLLTTTRAGRRIEQIQALSALATDPELIGPARQQAELVLQAF